MKDPIHELREMAEGLKHSGIRHSSNTLAEIATIWENERNTNQKLWEEKDDKITELTNQLTESQNNHQLASKSLLSLRNDAERWDAFLESDKRINEKFDEFCEVFDLADEIVNIDSYDEAIEFINTHNLAGKRR